MMNNSDRNKMFKSFKTPFIATEEVASGSTSLDTTNEAIGEHPHSYKKESGIGLLINAADELTSAEINIKEKTKKKRLKKMSKH